MSSTVPSPTRSPAAAAPSFKRVLCGVNGARPASQAMRQALPLAAAEGGTVDFVAICDARGAGPGKIAGVGAHRAEHALAIAHDAARDAGVPATAELVYDSDPTHRLLELARDHDMLVVGSRSHSRAAEIALGGFAGRAAHSSPVPVLIARGAAPELVFPGPIVVATDGREQSRAAIAAGARLAGLHGAALSLVHAAVRDDAAVRHELALQATAARDATGNDPLLVSDPGHPVDRVLQAAHDQHTGLIVVGSGGRTGLRALGSVSERIAAQARCSVLIMRGPGQVDGVRG